MPSFAPFSNRLASLLLPIFLFLGVLSSLRADLAFSSYDGTNFETTTVFGQEIYGAAAGAGVTRSAAFRFSPTFSGILDFAEVELLADSAAGASARIVIFADAGGKLGGALGSWDITTNIPVGQWRGCFRYNIDDGVVMRKGVDYWIGVEPFDDNSHVFWALGKAGAHGLMATVTSSGTAYTKKTQQINTLDLELRDPGVPSGPVASATLAVGDPVPNEPAGTTFGSLGSTPQAPLLGSLLLNHVSTPAIFAANGDVRLRLGGSAPALSGSVIAKLGQPNGDAVIVSLKPGPGGVLASQDTALVAGLQSGTLRLAAQAGVPLGSNGPSIKAFGPFDGNGSAIFFLATLQGSGVTAINHTALCAALADGSVKILARTGDPLGANNIAAITTLVGLPGTLADGRWRAGSSAIGVRLTLSDKHKTQVLYTIPAGAASSQDWTRWVGAGDTLTASVSGRSLAGAVVAGLGYPGFGAGGVAHLATLEIGPGGVTKADNIVVLSWSAATSGYIVVAGKGDPAVDAAGAPLGTAKFAAFTDPIRDAHGRLAFGVTLTGAPSGKALYWTDATPTLRLLARAGDTAPGGGKWASFSSLAISDDTASGPIVVGSLAPDPASNVTSAFRLGVWAIDSTNSLSLIIRNGGFTALDDGGGQIKGLSALTGAVGSTGAARGYDASGNIEVLVNVGAQRALLSLQPQ